MKNSSIIALACLALCACSTQVTEEDYKNALINYIGQDNITPESLTLTHSRDITVEDSIGYYTTTLTTEYQTLLVEKKDTWEKKQADCELDEKAHILRHEDYMKKYNDAKRKYGNDIKYKNKIDGYLKAAQKLPSNHEEYIKYDSRRDYSFTRDAENLKVEYETFEQQGVENYIAQHPLTQPYLQRDTKEVIASVYRATYTTSDGSTISEEYVLTSKPLEIKEKLDTTQLNIVNYNTHNTTATPTTEE